MKVLIISHNPISTYQSMGKTMLSFFQVFKKEELCQLYIYPTIPDIDVCESYYRITDKDIIHNAFTKNRKKNIGRIISSNEIKLGEHRKFENDSDKKLYNSTKTGFKMFVRDLLWLNTNWYCNSLRTWLEAQQPDCIFLAPGDAQLIYNVALNISSELNIPIITYICDEYYFDSVKFKGFEKYNKKKLRKQIDKLMHNTAHMVAICDELSTIYRKTFGTETSTIMTGSTIVNSNNISVPKKIQTITYLGNVALKRSETLLLIGNALSQINKKNSTDIKLNIYTGYINEKDIERLSKCDAIKLCGYVSGEEYCKVLTNSDALLHVESFDDRMMDRVKHSVSTKIADSLTSGVCLLAVGPSGIASINYLSNHKCAWVINNKENIQKQLESFITDVDTRESIVVNALHMSKTNHNAHNNSERLRSIVENNVLYNFEKNRM